ncbi:hypothetical protein SAMN02910357_02260 [Succinivibrio dextrinosolvens]|uniref:DUF6056 family protein n=1 Tax=Succinivibrio dextrinosolvens TaxID=83771 RepID=UPI0008E75DFD|nr:DUF6056 family protein [Succinivibrio dextrinosolvens]SFS85901.1 hypothetical protein SAMN02910357_02260 [Succinivibrio dextrinosolvens]
MTILKQAPYTKVLAFVVIFLAFFLVESKTPLHSDDFSYIQLVGLQAHINHYLGWSGRLVSDFSSSIILNIGNHFVISVIIALFSVTLCYLIAAIPGKIFNKEFNALNFLLISALYWLQSPSIGQTNFWIVGACNYLVTTFFATLLLYLFVSLKDSKSVVTYICLFAVSLLAGCSNENLCLALVYTLFGVIALYKIYKIQFNHKLAVIVITGVVIGAMVLLLAPGNYARLEHPAFAFWKEMTLQQKISDHMHRSYDYVHFFISLVIFYLIELGFIFFSKKDNYKAHLIWSGLFFSSSIFALVVMVGAPYFPSRSYLGIFVFLLLAFSVCSDVSCFKAGFVKIHYALQIICSLLFIYSFALMYNSYSITKVQEALRNEHINYEREVYGADAEPEVPAYYFVKLLKKRDMFDLYHSEDQARYFHVKKISVKDVDYDYSALKRGQELLFTNKSSLENVKVYYQPGNLLLRNSTLLIESSSALPDKLNIEYEVLGKAETEKLTLSNPIKLKDRYYIGISRKLPDVKNVTILPQS